MIIYTKGTVKIVENPSIVEKFQLTEESAIEGFYCTYFYNLPKKFAKRVNTFRIVALDRSLHSFWLSLGQG